MKAEKYKPMLCPVCGEFYFTDLSKEELNSDIIQCHHCGWKYDLCQAENHDLKNDDGYSINELKIIYETLVKENPDYDYLQDTYIETPHQCPVCGKHTFSDRNSQEICPVCGWQDDALMESEPDKWAGNANDLCLADFKARYLLSLKTKS